MGGGERVRRAWGIFMDIGHTVTHLHKGTGQGEQRHHRNSTAHRLSHGARHISSASAQSPLY